MTQHRDAAQNYLKEAQVYNDRASDANLVAAAQVEATLEVADQLRAIGLLYMVKGTNKTLNTKFSNEVSSIFGIPHD